MATALVEEKIDEYDNVYVFTDNQSAIQTVEHPKRQSGQYIIKEILDAISRIHDSRPTCTIHLEWVPGHMNIEGNEQADQAAKAAAEAATSDTAPLTRMKSAQYGSIQAMVNSKWKTEWTMGRQNARRLRNMSQHPDVATGPKLYDELQAKKARGMDRTATYWPLSPKRIPAPV
jgi:RNase H